MFLTPLYKIRKIINVAFFLMRVWYFVLCVIWTYDIGICLQVLYLNSKLISCCDWLWSKYNILLILLKWSSCYYVTISAVFFKDPGAPVIWPDTGKHEARYVQTRYIMCYLNYPPECATWINRNLFWAEFGCIEASICGRVWPEWGIKGRIRKFRSTVYVSLVSWCLRYSLYMLWPSN